MSKDARQLEEEIDLEEKPKAKRKYTKRKTPATSEAASKKESKPDSKPAKRPYVKKAHKSQKLKIKMQHLNKTNTSTSKPINTASSHCDKDQSNEDEFLKQKDEEMEQGCCNRTTQSKTEKTGQNIQDNDAQILNSSTEERHQIKLGNVKIVLKKCTNDNS